MLVLIFIISCMFEPFLKIFQVLVNLQGIIQLPLNFTLMCALLNIRDPMKLLPSSLLEPLLRIMLEPLKSIPGLLQSEPIDVSSLWPLSSFNAVTYYVPEKNMSNTSVFPKLLSLTDVPCKAL